MNKKRFKFLVLLFSIIFTLTACTNGTDKKENESNNSSLQEDTNKTGKEDDKSNNSQLPGNQTLNVATLSRPGLYGGIDEVMLEKVKIAMREIYPDFEINIKTFEDIDTYNKSIQVSLMSGQPYDLVYVDSDLQISKFIENEYFKDIYELIENDKSVDIGDYYVNALKAFESNGKLYRMPMNYNYSNLIGINTKISKESIDQYKKLDSISVSSMLDMYKQNKDNNNLAIVSSIYHAFMIEPSIATYINYENKTCDFNNDRFKNFLIDIKDSMFSVTGYLPYYENFEFANDFIPQDGDFIRSTMSMFTRRDSRILPQSLLDYVEPYFEHFIPMINENGEVTIASDTIYCIGNTANAEMAWDFLKFYIDVYNEDLTLFENFLSFDIPIKKDFLVDKMTYHMYLVIATSSGTTIEWNNIRIPGGSNYGGDLIYDNDTIVKRAIEKLERYNKLPMTYFERIDTDNSLYTKVINEFMRDLITVDQAAQQIQNNMSIFLSE